jgi:CheY-like chemotaxis protein
MTSAAGTGPRPRVLLADDYPELVKAVSRLLSLDCDIVGTVGDGLAVLDEVRRLEPDVVVVDLNLPNLHGLDACRRITQMYPATKVIVYTATIDPDIKQRSLEVGASAFVSKIGVDNLLVAIKQLFAVPG